MKRKTRPLFVSLTRDAFEDFLHGKEWELRKAELQWNERQVFPGRKVTLACGYSGPRMKGLTIGKVIFGKLEEIFQHVPWKKVEPRAENEAEAIKLNLLLVGQSRCYVAFQVGIKF